MFASLKSSTAFLISSWSAGKILKPEFSKACAMALPPSFSISDSMLSPLPKVLPLTIFVSSSVLKTSVSNFLSCEASIVSVVISLIFDMSFLICLRFTPPTPSLSIASCALFLISFKTASNCTTTLAGVSTPLCCNFHKLLESLYCLIKLSPTSKCFKIILLIAILDILALDLPNSSLS